MAEDSHTPAASTPAVPPSATEEPAASSAAGSTAVPAAGSSTMPAAPTSAPATTTVPASHAPQTDEHGTTTHQQGPLEAESFHSSETDSAFGGDDEQVTPVAKSAEHDLMGPIVAEAMPRRWHPVFSTTSMRMADGTTVIAQPNDDKEQDRLDLLHHIHMMVTGGELHRSPIKNPSRILDIGTGTGIWAIEMADKYPEAEVIGTDLSAIQPGWVPPNLSFLIDDAESPWPFPASQKFSIIHLRSMGGSLANWAFVLRQAYTHLEPGGWVEISDFEAWASTDDNSLPETSSYWEFEHKLDEASTSFGRKMNVAPEHRANLVEAGFVGVRDDVYKVPLSPWVRDKRLKEISRYMQVQMLEAVEAYGLALFHRVLGWPYDKCQVFFVGVKDDLRNRNYHMYSNLHIAYGQKPLDAV